MIGMIDLARLNSPFEELSLNHYFLDQTHIKIRTENRIIPLTRKSVDLI
jgi:hypothetical protein